MNVGEEHSLVRSFFQDSCRRGAVPVEKIRGVRSVTYGASSRRYYRVQTESGSYVICLEPPFSPETHPFLQVQGFLAQVGVRVPYIYDFDPEKGRLLEEDLGDDTLLDSSIGFDGRQELEAYKKCVDLLIKCQSFPLEGRRYPFQKLFFDSKKFDFEIDFTIKHLFPLLLKAKVEKWQREIASIRTELKKINKVLAEKSMVFSHRDFHSRNIMVKDGALVVIDFQDARLGIPQYDLASLLDDCYYELDSANRESIKKYYFNQLSRIVDDQKNYSDFLYFYDLMCIQRVFKAMGTFSFIFNSRGDERYLKYIAFCFEKIKKIMWKYQDFHDLRKNLAALYYEN